MSLKRHSQINGKRYALIPVDVAKTMLHPYTLKMFMEGPMADTDRSS
jgi:hypothetical protein